MTIYEFNMRLNSLAMISRDVLRADSAALRLLYLVNNAVGLYLSKNWSVLREITAEIETALSDDLVLDGGISSEYLCIVPKFLMALRGQVDSKSISDGLNADGCMANSKALGFAGHWNYPEAVARRRIFEELSSLTALYETQTRDTSTDSTYGRPIGARSESVAQIQEDIAFYAYNHPSEIATIRAMINAVALIKYQHSVLFERVLDAQVRRREEERSARPNSAREDDE